ncbi:MAG: DUF4412 domain-containing protein [FCB group bacterium]|nr:DUF4412 domain-containing protein [FCB group bacterium]
MKYAILMLAFACLFGLSSVIQADIVLTQKSSIVTMGMGTSMISTTMKIKGDMNYTQMLTTPGTMAGMPGGGESQEMENIIINRLDKGVMWILTPQAKLYNEMKFEELKAITAGATQESSPDEADKYEWLFDVDNPTEATINEYKCKGLRSVATGVSKTDETDRIRITYELWMGQNLPGGKELANHFEKFSELSGQDKMAHADMAKQMFRNVGPQFAKLAEAVSELKGFPVKLIMSIETGAGSGTDADGNDPQAMMQRIQSMRGGGEVSEDGMQVMMSVTTMLTSIEEVAVDGAIFEIPEGYSAGF